MKKDKAIEYIFVLILCGVLFFNLFVLNIFENQYVLAIFLLIYFIICGRFVKSRKIQSLNKKNIIILMVVFAVIYILILYVIGIFVGFYKNSIRFNIREFINRILPLTAIIIFSELIRNIFINRNDRKSTIGITITLILVDVSTYINLYNVFNLEEVLALIGYVCLSSVSINLLCNYIVKRHSYVPNILYRIITTIYIYIFGILPDIYLFFQTVIRIIYPYIIYLVIDFTFSIDNFKIAVKNKKINVFVLIIAIFLLIGMVLLISCEYRYGIMVVGSSSMTGSINKGDAIVFEQYNGQELEEGEIIIFDKEQIVTIHRIKNVQILNGETIYYTKGDYNQQQDEGYRTSKDIRGIVKFKIMYIGWPTIWVNELFSNYI